jgi:Tol biopolymer transport system component
MRAANSLALTLICLQAMVLLQPVVVAAPSQDTTPLPEFEINLRKDIPNPHNPFWISTEKLGFVSEYEGPWRTEGGVYVFNLQTSKMERLLDSPVLYPSVLSDQQRLSFADVGKHQSLSLFTISLTGQDRREYDFDGAIVFAPSWSPDRKRVVFVGGSHDAGLGVVNVQTKEFEDVGDAGLGHELSGTEGPDWSPIGTEIVYVGWDKRSRVQHAHLYRLDLRLHRYYALTSGPFQDRSPSYSPDGRNIAFVSNRSANPELWMINSDGSGLRRLTDMGSRGYRVAWEKPAWNPDQRTIAFSVVPIKRQSIGGLPFEGLRIWAVSVAR